MPKLAEWHIYGNEQQGRFVTRKPETEPCYYLGGVTNDVAVKNFYRIMDKKEYELKDHLGNVRAVVGDVKMPLFEGLYSRGTPPFLMDEKAINDYYPFGMTIADRSYSSTFYRSGYNMQEKSLELNVDGNHNTAEFWEYDARSGRRWNLDPVVMPWESSYATFGDDPINFNDINGDKKKNNNPVEDYKDTPLAPVKIEENMSRSSGTGEYKAQGFNNNLLNPQFNTTTSSNSKTNYYQPIYNVTQPVVESFYNTMQKDNVRIGNNLKAYWRQKPKNGIFNGGTRANIKVYNFVSLYPKSTMLFNGFYNYGLFAYYSAYDFNKSSLKDFEENSGYYFRARSASKSLFGFAGGYYGGIYGLEAGIAYSAGLAGGAPVYVPMLFFIGGSILGGLAADCATEIFYDLLIPKPNENKK